MLCLLLSSCKSNSAGPVGPKPITKCAVPVGPEEPEVTVYACGTEVCMSPEDASKMAWYLHETKLVEEALDGCSLIERVTE